MVGGSVFGYLFQGFQFTFRYCAGIRIIEGCMESLDITSKGLDNNNSRSLRLSWPRYADFSSARYTMGRP